MEVKISGTLLGPDFWVSCDRAFPRHTNNQLLVQFRTRRNLSRRMGQILSRLFLCPARHRARQIR